MTKEERNLLYLKNKNLIYFVVNRYFQHSIADVTMYDDLLQEGGIGLLKAIEMYKPETTFKFSSYATQAIYRNCIRFYKDNYCILKMPQNYRTSKSGTAESDKLKEAHQKTISLDNMQCIDEVYNSLSKDKLGQGDIATVENKILIKDAFETLTPYQKELIILRYYENLTLVEIGKHFDISSEWARREIRKALYKMRLKIKAY